MPNFVFFCEGPDEGTLVKQLNTDIYGPNSTRWKVAPIPRIVEQPGQKWFTPKRILDYYLDTIGIFDDQWDYHYNAALDFRPNNSPRLNDVRERIEKGANVCLLIDSDVFFKNLQNITYTHLTPEQNYILKKGGAQRQIVFYDEFRNANNYQFLEQELTFEDFVVLFFVGEDSYDESDDRYIFDKMYQDWFIRRFGIGNETLAAQRIYSDKRPLSNATTNSNKLKKSLVELLVNYDKNLREQLSFETEKNQTLEDWVLEQENNKLASIISNWVIEYGKTVNLKDRIKIARNRIKEHPNWPFRFGLIDILEQEIENDR